MKLAELAFACYIYSHMSDYDSSYVGFLESTKPELDLQLEHHRMSLLKWLNKWGCRQFAREHHVLASEEIREWYQKSGTRIFPADVTLLSLSNENFALVEEVYARLISRTASRRNMNNGTETCVDIGPTGTSKILFALRPLALIPWDDPIRKQFGVDGSACSYTKFLREVRIELNELEQACEEKGHIITDLPNLLGRPTSSIAKMIDEYFWVTITRGCTVPPEDEISRWATWW